MNKTSVSTLGTGTAQAPSLSTVPKGQRKNRPWPGEKKQFMESFMHKVFFICAFFGILSVATITLYLLLQGLPAFSEVGVKELLLETVWQPTASTPKFGILYIILTSLVGTFSAIALGVPVAILSALYIAEIAPKLIKKIIQPMVELLAAIPSVVYGLIGIQLLNPLMYSLELKLFSDDSTHQFTGGANLISAVIVLAIMILPTVIHTTQTAISSVEPHLKASSLALGATPMQTLFKVSLPAAKSGVVSGIVLGIGRALGEAMAITLVSGGSVQFPTPFNSVRFLTTAIVSEMGYATGLHRQVLFSIGLVLFVFTMFINLIFNRLTHSDPMKAS